MENPNVPRIRAPEFDPLRVMTCAGCTIRVPRVPLSPIAISSRNEVAMRCLYQDQLVWSRSPRCSAYSPFGKVGSKPRHP
jgi:hypothetical protein